MNLFLGYCLCDLGEQNDLSGAQPEIAANLQAAYGLDQPIGVQYLKYLGNLVRGDLGPSFRYKDFRVTELLAQGLPVTLTIGAALWNGPPSDGRSSVTVASATRRSYAAHVTPKRAPGSIPGSAGPPSPKLRVIQIEPSFFG